MANKITVAEKFDMVKAFLEENGASKSLIDFVEERKELHTKKTTNRKPTEKQKANAELGEVIKSYLADNDNEKMQIKDMIANIEECKGLSTSKVSSIMKILIGKNEIERIEEKGTAYFRLAD